MQVSRSAPIERSRQIRVRRGAQEQIKLLYASTTDGKLALGIRDHSCQSLLPEQIQPSKNHVQNFFCRLKRWVCSSTKRDKLASHFLSFIQSASIIDWLRYGC